MTNTKDTESTPGPLDTVVLVAASVVVLGAIVAYYYFDEASILLRVVGIMASLGVAAALVYRTQPGRILWQFILGSRTELRKVIWPNRQETQQTTLAVFVFLLAFGAFFWVLDLALLFISRLVTGQGG
jgi:preprotein translocase subunit SecE